jgi:hypothetical protein
LFDFDCWLVAGVSAEELYRLYEAHNAFEDELS